MRGRHFPNQRGELVTESRENTNLVNNCDVADEIDKALAIGNSFSVKKNLMDSYINELNRRGVDYKTNFSHRWCTFTVNMLQLN